VLLCAPAAAQALTLYVDDSGSDALNNCQTPATPCDTIPQATSQPGAGNVIHVGGGSYVETVTLDNDASLIEDQAFIPAAAGEAVIDNTPTAAPAITVMSSGSLVEGLTVASGFTAISVEAAATITGNVFNFPAAPSGPGNADVNITAGAGSPTISGNTFRDTLTTDEQTAIRSVSTGSPMISGNSLEGFFVGIIVFSVGGATPVISGNEITGTHGTAFLGEGIHIGGGANPTVTANTIHLPGANVSNGLAVFQSGPLPNAGAALRRNRVIGHQVGLSVAGTLSPVTLDSDLIAGANGAGIQMNELGAGQGGGDVSATNVTVIDTVSGSDIIVGAGADLTLDSSIVGAGNVNPGINDQGTGTCAITFSRGDGNNGCASGFVTTADPMFVGAGDYHLLAGSPMIDAGNPLAPGAGVLDIDGDPRALDATPACSGNVARRDIGADEFVPASPVGCNPPDAIAPDTAISGKRKVRSRKKRVRVTFTLGSEPGASFQCSLDGRPYAPCTSPFSARLRRGAHTLMARATDTAGNQDASPASFTTRVKKKKKKKK
jgi:Right handed beta helix region